MCKKVSHSHDEVKISNIKISFKLLTWDLQNIKSICMKKSILVKDYLNYIVFTEKYTSIIFKQSQNQSNHVNVTKIKSINTIQNSILHLGNILNANLENITYTIDNITASGKLSCEVNLENFLKNNLELKTSYNIEKFPGLFIKQKSGTIILFSSGKFVIVGAKKICDLQNYKQLLKEKIENG